MSQFLKLYPGDKDFRQVSEKEWERPFEAFKDKEGFGNILGLSADIRVFDRPGGKLLLARKWPSRSFIRNFARIVRSLFQTTDIPLLDTAAAALTTCLNTVSSAAGSILPRYDSIIVGGAGMGVGDGVAAEDHLRNDLASRVGPIALAGASVAATVENTSTLTIQITQGITIAVSGGITAREIGLYLFLRDEDNSATLAEGVPTLVGYDQITPTAVAQGGVIAPRYTLNFPV